MPKIYEHAKNIPEAEERGRTFILDTAQKLSRLMLVSATWPLVLYMYNFGFKWFSLLLYQGPRSNFEIGGGAPLVTQYWGGGAQDTFSY